MTEAGRHADPRRRPIKFAHLYEAGGRTIRAPALLHAAIDAFELVVIPAAALSTFSPLIVVSALLVPLLALAVPRRLMIAPPPTGSRSASASCHVNELPEPDR